MRRSSVRLVVHLLSFLALVILLAPAAAALPAAHAAPPY